MRRVPETESIGSSGRGCRRWRRNPCRETLWRPGARRTWAAAISTGALDYAGTRFRAISLADLLERFDPLGRTTAVLLNCFDDYQGILSTEDIQRFDLKLATRIEVRPEYEKPEWLYPLLVLVPDDSDAPFQERFLTANIRELVFVDLEQYYAPLKAFVRKSEKAQTGYAAFVDNCLFCHSLKGVGGNKGVPLIETYFFFIWIPARRVSKRIFPGSITRTIRKSRMWSSS